jgi:aspartate/methionine/tyrosine aminotransferase
MQEDDAKISQRAKHILPFHVMDILAQAKALEAQGRDIIHLEVGEPDFSTPEPIIQAGIAALKDGKTHYTRAMGLPVLRQAIAGWYQMHYGVTLSPERIVVTPGASGALLLLMGAVLDRDKTVLLTDPGYPCNRHFARFVEGQATMVPVTADSDYQLTAKDIDKYWDDDTAMALLASPANPTGSVLSCDDLKALSAAVKAKRGYFVVDEIYHGLVYGHSNTTTALAIDDEAFVINSFSKFFGMTGWRLGWLVVPEAFIPVMDRLAQNLFIAPPTVSQYAALAAFDPDTLAILEERRVIFEQRRETLLRALTALGLDVKASPAGAFYIYADCQHFLNEAQPDSMSLSRYWLEEAGVAVTPGYDFGETGADTHIRFAYTRDSSRLLEAVERIAALYR